MKKVKYIGIRGHRGSGKNTIAYLLGNIIQWVIRELKTRQIDTDLVINDSVFNVMYRLWCDDIKKDESQAFVEMDTPNIYIESFGDTPRVLLQLITNIPSEYINSDYYKDHVIVNLKDFSWRVVDDTTNKITFDYQTLLSEIERDNITEISEDDIKLTLRDFIVYFAQVCMKYLGQDVWVKSMRCSDTDNDSLDAYYNIGTQYKIFRDIKAPSELTYVKDHNGVIIKVDRPSFKKKNAGVESLQNDNRWDYEVIIRNDISEDEDLKKQLVEIVFEIMRT